MIPDEARQIVEILPIDLDILSKSSENFLSKFTFLQQVSFNIKSLSLRKVMSSVNAAGRSEMPDIANRALAEEQASLDWVGMGNVHQPLKVKTVLRSKTCRPQCRCTST